MDPTTGAVKAMWSYPCYDPNLVVDPDFDQAKRRPRRCCRRAPGDPLLANAYQQRYMPGSTFKVLTTGIALEAGVIGLDSQFRERARVAAAADQRPDRELPRQRCGGDLTEVFARSCNIPFAQIAARLGAERMLEGVAATGASASRCRSTCPRRRRARSATSTTSPQNLPLLAIRGFGQNDDQMVPLHMAMVAATVANGGADDEAVRRRRRRSTTTATCSSQHPARGLEDARSAARRPATSASLMVGVAQRGTASCCIALDNGIQRRPPRRAPPSSTAPASRERSHAWIIAFAPAEHPQYAVAVMLKGTNAEISAGTGGRLAGPIAKADARRGIPPRRRASRSRRRSATTPATTHPSRPPRDPGAMKKRPGAMNTS